MRALEQRAAAGAARQRECGAVPGKEGEQERTEPRSSAAPRAVQTAPARPSRRGLPRIPACMLANRDCWGCLVNKEDYFCPLFNHGMQFVHSAEAGGTVQVTVRSLSGKGLDFISKSECSLLGL